MLIRQTILYLPAQFLSPVAQFLSMMIWTWWLAPEDMATFVLVTATQELAYMMSRSWFSFYTLRFLPVAGDHEGRRRYLGTESTLMLLLAIPELIAAAFSISFFAGGESHWLIFAIVGLYYVSRGMNNHFAERARAQNAIFAYTIFQTCGPVGGLLAGMIVVEAMGASAGNLLLAYGVMQAIGTVVALPMIGFSLRLGAIDMSILKRAAANGGPLLVLNCIGWVADNNIRYVVVQIGGAAAFGLLAVGWGIGRRCASVASMLVAAAAFPLAARLINEGDRTGAFRQLTLNTALLTSVLFPSMTGLALVGATLTDLAVAEAYREATRSVLALSAAAGLIHYYHVHVTDQALLLEQKYGKLAIVELTELVSTAVFAVIGFREAGLPGVVFGSALGSALTVVVSAVFALRETVFRFPVLDTVKITFATLAMAVAVEVTPWHSDTAGLIAAILIGGATYIAVMAVIYFPQLAPIVARWRTRAA